MRRSFFCCSTALTACVIVGACAASAQTSASRFYVVEVTAPSEEALHALVEMPFITDNVEGLTATLYLDEDQYAQVRAMGYPLRLLETQPDPLAGEKATGYITYDEIGPLLTGYAAAYPGLCRVGSLGQSVLGRELWVIMITLDPDVPADKPGVKYVSTLHGDEIVGTHLCLKFAEELLTGYAGNAYIQDLLGRTIFWLVPLANPDGYVNVTRVNANNWDINRSFPTYGMDFTGTWYDTGVLGDDGRQPEVAHLMRWDAEVHAALSANFHCGALVANYPYDYEPGISSGAEAISPDDDVFRYISLEYSRNNPPMYASYYFDQGITNGSQWYSITGGMMDWNYRYMGCPEVTMEISSVKRPNASALPQLWEDNRNSMFAYAETAHIGIRGLVRDRNDCSALWAKVLVADRDQPVFSNPEVGNYHRLLLPGTYDLEASSEGYISFSVDAISVEEGPATRIDLALSDGDINNSGFADDLDVQEEVDALLDRPTVLDTDVNGRGTDVTDLQAVINRTYPSL